MNRFEIHGSHNHGCFDVMTMAEQEFTAFFNAMTELYGSEQAELSADDWLEELHEVHALPSSTHGWRRITLNASTRVAARVNASSLSEMSETLAHRQ